MNTGRVSPKFPLAYLKLKDGIMKTTKLIAWSMVITTMSMVAGFAQQQYFPPPVNIPATPVAAPTPIPMPPPVVMPPPAVVAPPVSVAPPSAATVAAGVPDSYISDGDEFVGVIGTDYFYLGSGNLWVPLEAARLAHFQAWEVEHPDWREHAVLNAKFRTDAQGHFVPLKSAIHDNPDRQSH